ncbi:MAG: hypothetical protein JJT77_08835 [Crocinitomicaceae bacterium]|nr:hypothetical protein [Crocinitomicaceae bacterium]
MQTKAIQALVSLLDDPDFSIQQSVKEQILSQGNDVIPYLEDEKFSAAASPATIQRIDALIQEIKVANAMLDLKSWFKFPEKDIAKGWLKFSRIAYADEELSYIQQELENFKKHIWLEMNPRQTSFEKAKTLNYLFFEVFGFEVNLKPSAVSLLPDVLISKSGSPLALAALYSYFAYSNHFPVHLFKDSSNRLFLGCIDQSHIYRMLYGYPNLGNALFFMDIKAANDIVIPPSKWGDNLEFDNRKIQPMAHSEILMALMKEYNEKDQNEMRKSVCKQHLKSVIY